MRPRIDHVELTVAELDRAERFYDALLPLLGFDLAHKTREEVPEHQFCCVDYGDAAFNLTLVSPRQAYAGERVCRRRPGALHHLAFAADRPEEVDRLYEAVQAIPGARVRIPPRTYPEYAPDYYAFFFYDTEGIELEIVCFSRRACFGAGGRGA